MGSLLGAAAGSLLYGLVFAFSVAYLPVIGNDCCTQYSIVSRSSCSRSCSPSVRRGSSGERREPGASSTTVERAIGVAVLVVAVSAPDLFTTSGWTRS